MAAFYQHGQQQQQQQQRALPQRPLPPSPSFPTLSAFASSSSSSTSYQHSPTRQFPPSSSSSPELSSYMAQNMIKCSDCGQSVDLMSMSDHVCGVPSTSTMVPQMVPILPLDLSERRKRPDMRLDIEPAAPMFASAYGSTLSARSRSPNLDPGRLVPSSPLTPSSRPASPSPFYGTSADSELSRSVGSTSSLASSVGSKSTRPLPFFEKYQQMVSNQKTDSKSTTSSFSRSEPSQNLKLLSTGGPTPPLTPSPVFAPNLSHSPSPSRQTFNSTSTSTSSVSEDRRQPSSSSSRVGGVGSGSINRGGAGAGSINRNGGLTRPRDIVGGGRDSDTELPYASSTSSKSSSQPPSQLPSTSTLPLSSSPPRSRKISIPGPAPPPTRNGSLRDPVNLNGSASSYSHSNSNSSSSNSNSNSNSFSNFGENRQTIKASQSTPAKLSGLGAGIRKGSAGGLDACLEDLLLMVDDGDGGYADESQVSTPRPPKRNGSTITTSQSTPALSSTTSKKLFGSPPSTSSSTFNSKSSSPNAGTETTPQRPPSSQCVTCRKTVREVDIQRAGDGQVFCRPCYADRFLPKCRKCKLPIEGGAVASSDGKVLGKYHPACFSCFSCSEPFPNKEFYVFDMKPYCQQHYHELNGSLCTTTTCGLPIEGPCVSLVGEENGGGGRYHPECFKCSQRGCRSGALLEHHFVISGLPYCERHAELHNSPLPAPPAPSKGSSPELGRQQTSRAKKRQTIITRR